MSKAPGTSGTMPVTGAACGIKPSKKAMEVDFSIDFSRAKDFLRDEQTASRSEHFPNKTIPQDTPIK